MKLPFYTGKELCTTECKAGPEWNRLCCSSVCMTKTQRKPGFDGARSPTMPWCWPRSHSQHRQLLSPGSPGAKRGWPPTYIYLSTLPAAITHPPVPVGQLRGSPSKQGLDTDGGTPQKTESSSGGLQGTNFCDTRYAANFQRSIMMAPGGATAGAIVCGDGAGETGSNKSAVALKQRVWGLGFTDQ